MQNVTSKRLTSSAEINKHILANANLSTVVGTHLSLVRKIRRLFLSDELTREEVHSILYNVYHVDKEFSTLSVETIEFLAELGYEHEKIVKDITDSKTLMCIVNQYKYLDELVNHSNLTVKNCAEDRRFKINQLKARNSKILSLIDEIDLSKINVYSLTQNSISMFRTRTFDINEYRVNMEIVECSKSFTIHLHYNEFPIDQRQRAEEFFNKHTFRKSIGKCAYVNKKEGRIMGLSFEEVLQFIEKESHMKY